MSAGNQQEVSWRGSQKHEEAHIYPALLNKSLVCSLTIVPSVTQLHQCYPSGKITWLCCLCPHQSRKDEPGALTTSACRPFPPCSTGALHAAENVIGNCFFFPPSHAMCWCADCYSSSTESHRRVSHICSACCCVLSSSRRLSSDQ